MEHFCCTQTLKHSIDYPLVSLQTDQRLCDLCGSEEGWRKTENAEFWYFPTRTMLASPVGEVPLKLTIGICWSVEILWGLVMWVNVLCYDSEFQRNQLERNALFSNIYKFQTIVSLAILKNVLSIDRQFDVLKVYQDANFNWLIHFTLTKENFRRLFK